LNFRFTPISAFFSGCEIDKSTVTYSCRSCKKSGFASSENFLEHPCCKGEKQKIAMQQQQLQDASQDEKLVAAKDIEWRDVAGKSCFNPRIGIFKNKIFY
jgi:hypothetical protein